MTDNPKYRIGQTVYGKQNGLVRQFKIEAIRIGPRNKGETSVIIYIINSHYSDKSTAEYLENQVFATPEEAFA